MDETSAMSDFTPFTHPSTATKWNSEFSEPRNARRSASHNASHYPLALADHDEIREAQKLRHAILSAEFDTLSPEPNNGSDVDEFDEHSDHLVVRENRSGRIVGTYRMMPPRCAALIGERVGNQTFDLEPLHPIAADLVETGRSCVHPEHRDGAVISLLWSGIGEYMRRSGNL